MYPKRYFPFVMTAFKLGGVYDSDHTNGFWKYFFKFYNVFLFLLCPIYYTIVELVMLYYTKKSLYMFIDHIGMMFVHWAGNMKTVLLLLNRQKIKDVMGVLKDQRFHYEDFEDFRPGNILQNHFKFNEIFCRIFMFTATLVPISNQISALKLFIVEGHSIDAGNMTCQDILPYYCWFPFETETYESCRYAFLFQTVPMILFVYLITAFDIAFSYFASYLRAHFLCIRGAFSTFRERCLVRLNLPTDYELLKDSQHPKLEMEIKTEVRKITHHLQVIIRLHDELKSFYSIPLLIQAMSIVGILISCLYIISLEPLFSAEAYARFQYALGLFFQLSLYCFQGSEITNAALSVADGIYEANWYSCTKSVKTTMMINMMRMQRKVEFTVGKFAPLNMSTYVKILKGSYTYYTFLSQKKIN
ncbi:PREDICTED: odorant receptor 22c-like [Nicrophorus vespilloides]|uniref:Odorant receptor n=1 Tax=Nicrophorus vespilloides TaxID=110193 RepID=A0ABM1MFV0_NICVS|nr:PREDICTED: odorant receptor 22c-like [Nicrophorus vespilloides]